MRHAQTHANIRLEWGEQGINALAPHTEAIVVVDILSFSTCVDVSLSRGTIVFPYVWGAQSAAEFAHEQQAILAGKRRDSAAAYSLSPGSLSKLPHGTRLVLPSPNGSTLTLSAARYADTYAGCLRNAAALAHYLNQHYEQITIIASGERWRDGSIRPAIEDWLGVGAIISHLSGSRSAEAQLAAQTYQQAVAAGACASLIADSSSGRELREMGFADDVEYATAVDVSKVVASYEGDHYRDLS